MIQFYIPWEGEGGAMMKIWNKNTGPDFNKIIKKMHNIHVAYSFFY